MDFIAKCLEEKFIQIDKESRFLTKKDKTSDIYVDCRAIYSMPSLRQDLNNKLAREMEGEAFDIVFGDETAGIPLAAWAADRFQKKFGYLRKSRKEYGRKNIVEGFCCPGETCIIVTDLINTGTSINGGIDELLRHKLEITKIIAAFSRRPLEQKLYRRIPITSLYNVNSIRQKYG